MPEALRIYFWGQRMGLNQDSTSLGILQRSAAKRRVHVRSLSLALSRLSQKGSTEMLRLMRISLRFPQRHMV